MTTSQGTPQPGGQPAAKAGTAPGTELSARTAADPDAAVTAPLTGSVVAPPDDPEQLEASYWRSSSLPGDDLVP